jgi:alkylhydroperoxidase family enzyme
MLKYAVKLTTDFKKITKTDINDLHEAGFDERAIHDICTIAAYFAFVNRIAHGLGVELEDSCLDK